MHGNRAAPTRRYPPPPPSSPALIVSATGDHSTPVIFGDHSHEPVPLALASVGCAIAAMGGAEQLALRRPGQHIPLPDTKAPSPPLGDLLLQARQQAARRAAATSGRPFGDPSGAREDVGSWLEAWPQALYGDRVGAFDELSAGAGALGRFPGSEVMPLIKRFVGVG